MQSSTAQLTMGAFFAQTCGVRQGVKVDGGPAAFTEQMDHIRVWP